MGTDISPNARVDVRHLVEAVRNHPLYEHVCDESSLRLMMRAHVFAVWDFQSLLKALQRCLTCVEVPWLPTDDAEARRLINEIVLDEESDSVPGGGYLSHFELYLRAMTECGADTGPIRAFVRKLREGHAVDDALGLKVLPRGVTAFVRTTMDIARSPDVHRIAAAFSFGREEVIPQMFQRLVDGFVRAASDRWSTFHYYLTRHIGQDTERHGPLSRRLVARLCGTDDRLWSEAEAAARVSLQARIALWDQILETIRA